MSNDRAKGRRVSGSYLIRAGRVLQACILVAVAIWPVGIQPQATQAAPPPPTSIATPTPQPTEPGLSAQGATPPSPERLPPEVEQARARQAIEAALAKYLRYWGPRYQVAPVEVAVEGEWAHGVARWQSETKTLSGPIHILAHRSADGTWRALISGSDGLYRQWVDAVPESLVPVGEKSQLRTQAAEADALRRPQVRPVVPTAVATVVPPSKEGPSEPHEPVVGPAYPTATPTPQIQRATLDLTGPVPLRSEQARRAALARMRTQVDQGRAPAWEGATLDDFIPLYDLSGEITAYLFPVSESGTPAGYLTVAALHLPNPVLEFSIDGSTPLYGALDLAEQKGYQLAASQRPLYLGLLTYGYELVGPSAGRRLVLDLFNGGTFSVTEEEACIPLRQRVRLDATQLQTQTIQPMVYNLIDGVPDWNQFWGSYGCLSGCSPTSATNVIGYWDSHGYGNLINGNDWQGAVNEMRSHMGTWCGADGTGWTNLNSISPAIVNYAQDHGYTFASEWWCDGCGTGPTYDRYRSEIDGTRPIVVDVIGHSTYGNHTVTGVGYETNGSYMIIHDNWSSTSENVYLQYGSGYSSIHMHPVVPGGSDTDTTLPDGDITSPNENETITNRTVHLAGWAQDNAGGSGFNHAHFTAYYNGSWRQVGPDFTSSPFGFDWDMCDAGVPDGPVTIGLDIWDNVGNQANSPHGNRHFTKSHNCPSGNWQVTYYNDTNLGSQCSTASVDGVYVFQDWGDDAPTSGCNADNWSARFSRQVHFQSGEYTFGLGSDDWSRIRIGNDTVVNNWQGVGQHYESRVLSEGDYDVTVEFADTLGAARLAAWWWGPGFDVPRQSQDPSQWYAQYWGNKGLWWDAIVRVNEGTGRLAHSWDTGGPGYGLPNDRFSSRFERQAYFDCGRYRFHIFTDDGVRFWIDDQQRLDRWSDGVNGYDVYVDLSAGYHDLRLEHYESDGSAAISLDWFMESGCVPDAPSNLRATAVSPSQINLTWTDNSNTETGFRIYRNGSSIGQVGANITSYQDTGLTCGTSYSYYVRAYNSAGESGPSNTFSTRTQECTPLPDLHPYAPSGYTYPVVPSSIQGTHEVNTLYAGQPAYFDWHFINSGDVTASGDFHVELWVGDTRYVRYPYSNLGAGWSGGFDDWMETITTPGWHTVRLVTDPDDTVTESDETNNVWERQFYWTPSAPYADDMESGTNDWTATGLWHQVDGDSSYPESHSGLHSWWYGQEATGNYDTGSANSGNLTSPSIYIPASGYYYLRFWYRYETETQGPDWDQRWVQISVDGGPFNNVLQLFDDPMNRWLQSPAIELSGYAGHTIQVRFHFDTIDGYFNDYRGWYIDDLDISTAPPPVCDNDSHEPNDALAQATAITYGQTLSADICPGGDYDYYQFIGTAGDRVVVDIDAEVNGSLLDSYIFLLDSDGTSVLAENDDEILSEVQDSHLGYHLTHDGSYYIKVRAWDHPSAGGTDYFYTIHLLTDDTNPSSAEITSPGNSAWLDPSLETITVSASDDESGISRVEFWWHDADWQNSDWVWLGADEDGRDDWSWDFDTSSLAEQQGGALYIWAFDWAWNWTGAGVWNLGVDRTPPTAAADISLVYGDAPFLDFYVWWYGSDNLSDIASYDVQYRDGAGGTWTDLLTGTADTYYRFIGQDGHTYYFRARARDYAGNQSAYAGGDGDAQHTVQICPTAEDAYEPDDSYTAAKTFVIGDTWQSHNFHALGDQDWVTFTATAGIVYTLVTANTGGHADTVLYLYKSDGNTLIDSNDDDPDNWPASRLEWGATSGGTYYVKVEHWDSYAYGCTTAYDLSITETGTFTLPVYLPLIFKAAGPPMPDLVVDSLVATSDTVRVTIKNQGNVPVTDEFWVDVYFNPTETPSLNHPWDTIASHGVVWGVTTPIPANGGTLTLTTGDEYYFPDLSSPAPLPVGADVYVLVDSINYDTTYGVVPESNEDNNLFGPVTSTASVAGEVAPVGNQGQPPSMEGLPPRR